MAAKLPQVLAVLHPDEEHRRLVAPHIDRSRVQYIPIDLTAIPIGAGLSFMEDGTALWRRPGVKKVHRLERVRSVWWRMPLDCIDARLDNLHPDEEPYAEYMRTAVRAQALALGGYFPMARQVSNPFVMHSNDTKAGQLPIARSVGMSVPRTIQTSDPIEAAAFIRRELALAGVFAMKSMAGMFPVLPDKGAQMLWTQKFTRLEDCPLTGLELAPAIFQEYVPGPWVRVTVIGERLLAVRITGKLYGRICDTRAIGHSWRGKHNIEVCEVPPALADQILLAMKLLGMLFGAWDFIDPGDGRPWRPLEVNSGGAWGWIEFATGLPIGKTLAELLMAA